MKINLEKYHWEGQRVGKPVRSDPFALGTVVLGTVVSVLNFEMVIWWDDYARPFLYSADDPDFDEICIYESFNKVRNEKI